MNYGSLVLSIHVVQQFQAVATFLKRAFKVELLLCLVQNSIEWVEVATMKYDRNMAKQRAIIYLYLTTRIGTFDRKLFIFRAVALCAIFFSFGRLATCVERTELQSILTKFNDNFSSNETHFSDCLGKGFEIPAYEEKRDFEAKSVVSFDRDSLLKGALRI